MRSVCRKCCASYNGNYEMEDGEVIDRQGSDVCDIGTDGDDYILYRKIRMDCVGCICIFCCYYC